MILPTPCWQNILENGLESHSGNSFTTLSQILEMGGLDSMSLGSADSVCAFKRTATAFINLRRKFMATTAAVGCLFSTTVSNALLFKL